VIIESTVTEDVDEVSGVTGETPTATLSLFGVSG
jgi:hypothetical protein